MECLVLGSGGMMPTPTRMTASVLVRREGRLMLFDAGEGIQISVKRGGFGICSLDAVVISHLHADHVLGIPGILMLRAQCDTPGPLTVVGPPGIERFIRHTMEDLGYYLNYEISFVEWSDSHTGPLWSWNGHLLHAAPLEHSKFCLGYRLEEATRPGKFDVESARALGVPPGPLYGQLQAGQTVMLPDGRTIAPPQVMGPPRRGRVLAYATDTRVCGSLESLCAGADLAFVEGMFAQEHAMDAKEKQHMTASDAAAAAARAGARRLVLLHLSPRYTQADEERLLLEAQARFPAAEIARELAVYPVRLPD